MKKQDALFVRHLSKVVVVTAPLLALLSHPRMTRRRRMSESQPRKTNLQWTNQGARPKKKWSKGKVWGKLNNLVLLDKATSNKLCKEVPNYKLITPIVISARPKIHGSLARAALQDLRSKGLIKKVSKHRAQVIYTKNTKDGEAPAAGNDAGMGPTNCTFWKIKLQEARDNN